MEECASLDLSWLERRYGSTGRSMCKSTNHTSVSRRAAVAIFCSCAHAHSSTVGKGSKKSGKWRAQALDELCALAFVSPTRDLLALSSAERIMTSVIRGPILLLQRALRRSPTRLISPRDQLLLSWTWTGKSFHRVRKTRLTLLFGLESCTSPETTCISSNCP